MGRVNADLKLIQFLNKCRLNFDTPHRICLRFIFLRQSPVLLLSFRPYADF